MRELSRKTTTDLTKVLATFNSIAANDSSWMLRRAAIGNIAQILTPQTPESQMSTLSWTRRPNKRCSKLAKDEKSLVRADALGFLGATKDAKYADIYLAALNDQSYAVIDNAAVGLGATKSPQAFRRARQTFDRQSWRGRLQTAGLRGIAALGDKRALDLGLKFAADKTQPLQRSQLGTESYRRIRQRRRAGVSVDFHGVQIRARQHEFQGIIDGAQAITQLADPRGQEAFDLMKEKFKTNPQFLGYATLFGSAVQSGFGGGKEVK